MTTTTDLLHRLLPGPAWFVWWLKTYARVAIGTACGFMVVAGWVAEHSVLRTLMTAAAAVTGVLMFAGLFVPVTRTRHHEPPVGEPPLRRQIILSFHIASLWFSIRAGLRQREDTENQEPSGR
jgi:hypothetical protein